MNLLSIAGIAIAGLLIVALVRQVAPELATLVILTVGVTILALVIVPLEEAVGLLESLAGRAGIETGYIGVILKVVGVSYIAGFAAQMCRDAGESALAAKIELAGKVTILLTAIPIFRAIADALEGLAKMAL